METEWQAIWEAGNDFLTGGEGNDQLIGGNGGILLFLVLQIIKLILQKQVFKTPEKGKMSWPV